MFLSMKEGECSHRGKDFNPHAELEIELSKYKPMKEVQFFYEKASGKSKGYHQAEYFDPSTTIVFKEGMNVHVFSF